VWVAQPSATAQYVQIAGDTMTGPLSLEDAPTQPLHATNKQYVDANASSADKVSRSGDTMTGSLNLLGANRIKYDVAGTGFFIDTLGGVDRVFMGTWGAEDAFSVLTNVSGVVMKIDVPTGVVNFPLGGTVPNVAVGGSTKIANTAYVEQRASDWAALRVARTGDQMSGVLISNESGIVGQAGSAPSFEVRSASGNAAMAFHCVGAFGGNFGMATNGNFYMGGWSHGAVAHQIWTSRDFVNPLTSFRFVYVGDHFHQNLVPMADPFGPYAAVTGCATDGQSITNRYRQAQMFAAGAWYVIGYA